MSIPFQNHPLRLAALEAGQDRFLLEYPCKRGHVGLRYVSNGCCVRCNTAQHPPLKTGRKSKTNSAPKIPNEREIVVSQKKCTTDRRRNEEAAQRIREELGEPSRRRAVLGLGTHLASDEARERSAYLDSMIKNGRNYIQ